MDEFITTKKFEEIYKIYSKICPIEKKKNPFSKVFNKICLDIIYGKKYS